MHSSGHPITIALAIALAASPLALLTPAAKPVQTPLMPAADTAIPQSSVNGKPLTDAPLSRLAPPDAAPATEPAASGFHSDQAGPLDGTPFSAAGSGTLNNNTTGADGSLTSSDKNGPVPDLGR